MKAILNVEGKKLEVVSINLNKGEITSVQVDYGNHDYQTYYDRKTIIFREDTLVVNMKEALEFPELEERIAESNKKLIEHLDELVDSENDVRTAFAVEAMEQGGLPFNDLALVNSQREYKLIKERALGFLDAVEEVKAYTEGYYADKNNEPVKEEDNHRAAE